MSKENPSFQEKLHSIESQSNQIDRALGLAFTIVDDTKSVIGEYFPKDILPTDASTKSRLANLVDLGMQRENFVQQ
ncbi:MAG: hypothetical protein Q7T54_05750, partial [Candidatus Levybacteria bacterium]|nr:hypothetical protein [Candidatus Levybacteria bacterium]